MIKDIQELLDEGVIDEGTATKIKHYYLQKQGNPSNKFFIVFGILGAILAGLGVILIIAHNWDNLSLRVKTILAFLPILINQGLCLFTLLKKPNSIAWRESTSILLFFGIGASMSLISQIYHIQGDISSFMLTWMGLVLPLVYLMNSSITSLLFISGITYYAVYQGYDNANEYVVWYWILFLSVMPHYYVLITKKSRSLFTFFHHWLIPIALLITLGIFANDQEHWMFVAYVSLLGVYIQIGMLPFLNNHVSLSNGYKIIGSLGTVIMLLILSFQGVWDTIYKENDSFSEGILSVEFTITLLLTLTGIIMLLRNKIFREFHLHSVIFIIFFILFILGLYFPFSVIFVNLLLLALGIITIREGLLKNHLGELNYGLLIITVLVFCRFFDTDIPFILRGVLFLAVGLGFFGANYYMLKKRKVDVE